MNDIVISQATSRDREALRRVSQACYEDDYVLAILEDMLQTGTVLLASSREEPAGFVYFDTALDGSTWLSSLRVIPSRRRQGIGEALCRAGERVATEAGSQEIRLWTAESNAAARALFEDLSYHHITDFTRWWRALEAEEPRQPTPVTDPSGVPGGIRHSTLLEDSRGYVPLSLKFCRFEDTLEALPERGGLYLTANGDPLVLDDEIWEMFDSPTVELTLLGDDLRGAIEAALGHAAAAGREGVGTYLPYGTPWAERARRIGLELGTWGRHARLYAKKILGEDGGDRPSL